MNILIKKVKKIIKKNKKIIHYYFSYLNNENDFLNRSYIIIFYKNKIELKNLFQINSYYN